jgi:hypothetical protein
MQLRNPNKKPMLIFFIAHPPSYLSDTPTKPNARGYSNKLLDIHQMGGCIKAVTDARIAT